MSAMRTSYMGVISRAVGNMASPRISWNFPSSGTLASPLTMKGLPMKRRHVIAALAADHIIAERVDRVG